MNIRNQELIDACDYGRTFVETMHESLLILTSDFRIKTANRGFCQTFQVSPGETEGHNLFEIGNHQWDIPELRKHLGLVLENGIPFTHFEVTHDFPGIGVKSMLLNALKFPIKDGHQSLVLLAIHDLTERKQMEKTLKENEEHFRLLVQNASDIITLFEKGGTIKYESPAIESVLGYKPEERVGRNISIDTIVHPDDRKIKLSLLQKAIDNPRQNVHGEFRLRHKNGTYRTIDAIFRSLLNDPKVNGVIANYRDITDRKNLEQQKDEFIGIASHELKTPVTSIKAYSQVLEDIFRKGGDIKSAEMINKINHQVDRLTTLIIDLLDFTRLEGGKLKFRDDKYDLNDLISEVVEEMQRTSKQHKIVMKLGKTVRMTGDRYRTSQVLTNLLSNAIKYSPKAKNVILSSKVNRKEITVCVQDFGIGIDKGAMPRVFDRFFRVTEPTTNTFPGLGLGLYIAAEIVRRQDGKIWVSSTKGKGSTFCFSLPVRCTVIEN